MHIRGQRGPLDHRVLFKLMLIAACYKALFGIFVALTVRMPDGKPLAYVTSHADSMLFVISLVRYQTGDCGCILPYGHVSQVLRSLKYDAYVPALEYPLLAVAGRTDQSVTVAGKTVRMEFLRSLLYSERTLASTTTGQFHVTVHGGRLRLRIQLQATIEPRRRATIQAQWSSLFNRHVPAAVNAVPYFDFRDALSVDYERKFRHL